jgi:hypothetical protein
LALTRWRLFIHANMLRTGSDPHRIGLQSVKALTGPPDHDRHDRQ